MNLLRFARVSSVARTGPRELFQARRVSSSFWRLLRGKLTSRLPHTAMYNDGPARRASVSVFAKPTSSMKPSASTDDSTRSLFVASPPAVATEFDQFGERRSHDASGLGQGRRGQQKRTSGWIAHVSSLWERLGEGAKLESQNRRPTRGFRFCESVQWYY